MAEQAERLCVSGCGRPSADGLAICCLHCEGPNTAHHHLSCDARFRGPLALGYRDILTDLIEQTSGSTDRHVNEVNGEARERLRELEGKEKEVDCG